jgi:hypothetical protein
MLGRSKLKRLKMRRSLGLYPKFLGIIWGLGMTGVAQAEISNQISQSALDLKLDQQIIESSPVLRRWLIQPPDILDDIYNSPSFSTKFHLGLTARDRFWGFDVGVQDIFLGRSPLTISARYQHEFSGQETAVNANLRYYILPLGYYFNIAPQIGYRYFDFLGQQSISGIDVGLQGILVLSPHSADLRLAQTFTAPGTNQETSITTLSTSYAVTKGLSIGSNIEWRRSPLRSDSRVGFFLEWLLR